MSTLWTPDGERPIEPPVSGDSSKEPSGPKDDGRAPLIDEKAMANEVEQMRAELASAPVETVIANHCYGMFELAAVYLSQVPPLLDQARLAIDALGLLVGGLEDRLGEAEEQLKDGLSQLRLAYVQIDGAQRANEYVASGNATNGSAETADTESDAPSTPDEPSE